MIKDRRNKSALMFTIFFLLLGIGFTFALEVDYPAVPGAETPTETELDVYIKYIINLVIWVSGILALGVLIFGAVRYLTSTGKPEAIISAREYIRAGFFGLLIILGSFIVLKTISPELVILKLPELPEIAPEIALPDNTLNTSVDAEMPFARVIEGKILEEYVSDSEEAEEEREPRLTRIEKIAENILKIVAGNENEEQGLVSQSSRFPDFIDDCECLKATNTCGDPCSGDTCDGTPRAGMIYLVSKNSDKIDELLKEQQKAYDEIYLLKQEIGRLERAEKFIKECRPGDLNSFADFLIKKDVFDSLNREDQIWLIREIQFWDDIDEIYIKEKENEEDEDELVNDFATFECAVSGTLRQTGYSSLEIPKPRAFPIGPYTACSPEAPVGEIIDRTKRLGYKLIERLEKLALLSGEMIKAVDELHSLVSQCTSQLPRCFPICIEMVPLCIGVDPCLSDEIDEKIEKIKQILEEGIEIESEQGTEQIDQGIKDIVEYELQENDDKEKIGILSLTDPDGGIISALNNDLEVYIRRPMAQCSIEAPEGRITEFINCLEARGGTTPRGEVIRVCCEGLTPEEESTVFGGCLGQCYLEKGQEKYRNCLQKCLNKEAEQRNDELLAACLHRLNFYCCTTY